MTETETDWAEKIGAPAYGSIAEMVAALECDYDRLEELHDAVEAWTMEGEEDIEEPANDVEMMDGTTPRLNAWAEANPDDAEELKGLEEAAGECESQEDAKTRISEDALDITIRGERREGEWEADEFTILLTTGGPAVRIKGELGGHSEPSRAWLEVQDWYKPWTQYFPADQDTLLTYCRQFNFE